MNALTPFTGGRLPRPIERAVMVERGRGAVAAQRVQVVGIVAEIGLRAVAHLSAIEVQLVRQNPRADARLSYIVDAATNAIAEAARLGTGW
jgi:hypothetical protein